MPNTVRYTHVASWGAWDTKPPPKGKPEWRLERGACLARGGAGLNGPSRTTAASLPLLQSPSRGYIPYRFRNRFHFLPCYSHFCFLWITKWRLNNDLFRSIDCFHTEFFILAFRTWLIEARSKRLLTYIDDIVYCKVRVILQVIAILQIRDLLHKTATK